MITLNRLGHSDEPFQLNPDMIVTVEANPDTVITLATGAKVVVAETPEEVAAAVHAHRTAVMSDALRRRSDPRTPPQGAPPPTPAPRGEPPRLSAVEDTPG
jgi:flagellar protein FlbD